MFSKIILLSLVLSSMTCVMSHAAQCNGALQLDSNQADVFEEYSKRVRVFVPLKIQVSNNLLKCADEIWVEAIDSSDIWFWGDFLSKKAKLLDSQFKRIKRKRGVFKANLDQRTTQMWLRLQHYSFFPSGRYSAQVRVSVVSNNQVIKEQLIDLTYYSEPKISITLDSNSQSKVSGSNGDYQIDLGELRNGARFNWGINILSNSAYDIVLDSEFNGLRHQTNTSAIIDYSIKFDNVKISSSEQLVRSYDYWWGVKNTWFGFSFELGNVELMPAGKYQDHLSLTVYPY